MSANWFSYWKILSSRLPRLCSRTPLWDVCPQTSRAIASNDDSWRRHRTVEGGKDLRHHEMYLVSEQTAVQSIVII